MSAASLLSPTSGQILNQYLPSAPAPHPYVENPMYENLDCGGFQITNVGTYPVALSYTQTGGAVTNPLGPVAQPLDAGLYYMTVSITLNGVGANPANLYYDVRNQNGSIQMVQNVITAAEMNSILFAKTVHHVFQVPSGYSAYINYAGNIGGALNLGVSGSLSMTLTRIF